MGVDVGRSNRARRRLGLGLAPVVVAVALQSWLLLGTSSVPLARAQTPTRPNIVLILTDDQRFDTLHVMPEVQRLAGRGMLLRRAIVSNPLCCPSRATILTGRYSHTTGVYTNVGANGGWTAFKPWESETIATALDAAGYRTALIGKYLNGYAGNDLYVPPGWDRWSVFVGVNGRYYDYKLFDDRSGIVTHGSMPRDYSTDVIRRKSVAFIRHTPSDTPLFLLVAPYAPHGPNTAAPRHEGMLAAAPVKLSAAVNERDVSDKPRHIRDQNLAPTWIPRRWARDQWETLLAVDQLIGRVVEMLRTTGRLSNTLFVFTSDNGISNREHRWPKKQVPYEESIRVPLVIAYPGEIHAGLVTNALVSNVDLAPTIADFADAPLTADGVSLRPLLTEEASSVRNEVLLEHLEDSVVPTYCGVRTPNFLFARYATGEEELYDMVQDPSQLQNVVAARPNKAAELRTLTRSLCQPKPPGFSW